MQTEVSNDEPPAFSTNEQVITFYMSYISKINTTGYLISKGVLGIPCLPREVEMTVHGFKPLRILVLTVFHLPVAPYPEADGVCVEEDMQGGSGGEYEMLLIY